MVERVARGKIMVPAAAALTVMAAGAIDSAPAQAAGRDATLQIRVQVVEPCRIRIAPSGALEQSCDGSSTISAPGSVQLGNLFGRPTLRMPALPTRSLSPGSFTNRQPVTSSPGLTSSTVRGPTVTWSAATEPAATGPSVAAPSSTRARFVAANQRAGEVAEQISQRVRFITVAY